MDQPKTFSFAASMTEFVAVVVQALHKMKKRFDLVFIHATRMADSGGQKVSQGHKWKNLVVNVPGHRRASSTEALRRNKNSGLASGHHSDTRLHQWLNTGYNTAYTGCSKNKDAKTLVFWGFRKLASHSRLQYLLSCEHSGFQRSQAAGSPQSHGCGAQGPFQSAGSGGASATGFFGGQWGQVAHHQLQTGRPSHVQMGVTVGFSLHQFSEVLKLRDATDQPYLLMGGQGVNLLISKAVLPMSSAWPAS